MVSGSGTIVDRMEKGLDVLERGVSLDIMHGVKDETAGLVEDLDPVADFTVDLARLAEGHRMLRIHTATPKSQAFAELILQPRCVHVRGGALDRVQNVEASPDEIRKELVNRPAGERRPLRIQDVSAASSILEFLVTAGAYAACLDVRNKRQEAMTSFEGFDQKSNALFTILSTVVKTYSGTAMDIVRSMM